MRIYNGQIFVGHNFTNGGIDFDRTINDIGSHINGGGIDDFDAAGCYVIPGLIDVHTHAAVGEDASDGDVTGLVKMSKYYAAEGVTSWLPTTMTLKEPELTKAMKAISEFKRPEAGAKIAGVNFEGPFLSYEKRGAQNPDNLSKPDIEMFKRLNDISGGIARLITVAPETEGALDFISEVSKQCTVSLGHTISDYDTAMRAYDAGASHATHLFNGMNGLHHRNPGVIAAASDSGATVELITDGLHIHPAAIRLTQRLFGDKLVLISDSLRCAGMPDGDYELGGQPITVKNGKATLTGTDTLAGSSIHLMEGLRRSVSFGISLEDAVYAASTAAAKAIRMNDRIGSLNKGLAADIVILDKELNVKAVFVDGCRI